MVRRIVVVMIVAVIAASAGIWARQPQLQKIVINFPNRGGGAAWPMFIAKEGGYYAKYGLDVTLAFGAGSIGVAMISSGEAAMTNSSLEQALQAASRDPDSLVMLGSTLNKGMFAMMAANSIPSVKELKGKRFGVSQIGDAPYNYAVALLSKFGVGARDVQWVPVGIDATARAVALTTGRVDATLLAAPQYFKVEEQGFRRLVLMADYNDIYAATTYLFTKKWVAANPGIAESIIKANAEAVKRFYDDKPFAVKAYLVYDKQEQKDVERVYDLYATTNAIERIPYVMASAVKSVIDQANEQASTQIKPFDLHKVIDNGMVGRLVKSGFFQQVFGNGIKSEQEKKAAAAFK